MKALRSDRVKRVLADPEAREKLRTALAQQRSGTEIRQTKDGRTKKLLLKFVPAKIAA